MIINILMKSFMVWNRV